MVGRGVVSHALEGTQQPERGQDQSDFVIGVLAIQGSYPLHEEALRKIGVATRHVRRAGDLYGLAGLVIPGGESTVMSRLAIEYKLFDELKAEISAGLPVFGTCAGAILLGETEGRPPTLGVVPILLMRNAYGRQVDSFTAPLTLSLFSEPFPGIFIRAPKLCLKKPPRQGPQVDKSRGSVANELRVLAEHNGDTVLLQVGHNLLATFHPELTDDLRLHRYFVQLCTDAQCRT